MNDESALLSRLAITLAPKLNNRVYLPVMERCGGIEGFFQEREGAIRALYN